MEDTDSVTANVDINPPPVQIHQLATLLWNILNNDREANQAILERLENTEGDLLRHPVQIFAAADLAHLASHLAETTRTLANQAYEMEAMSDLSEWTLRIWSPEPAVNSDLNSTLYFDSAIIATSSVRAPIRAHWTISRKKPRGSEACVWTIWKDVKLLFSAAVWCYSTFVSGFSISFVIFFHMHEFSNRGTQHFNGTVSNEATSEMGYPAWPAGRTCQFFQKWEEAQPKNLHVVHLKCSICCTVVAIWKWTCHFGILAASELEEPQART